MIDLPFEPESFESMKARYHLAIADPLDMTREVEELRKEVHDRKHIFDFSHGMRLLVTLDLIENGAKNLHASLTGHSPTLAKTGYKCPDPFRELLFCWMSASGEVGTFVGDLIVLVNLPHMIFPWPLQRVEAGGLGGQQIIGVIHPACAGSVQAAAPPPTRATADPSNN